MVNKTETNGINNGKVPPDEALKETLHDFARRQLSVKFRLKELDRIYGYTISKRTLTTLNKKFQVPSVRKPPPLPVVTALVAEKIAEDTIGRHGPLTIQKQLARENGMLIPRDTIRAVAATIDPEGPERRFPGRKKPVKPRGQLKATGIMEEVHCDGHEKLGAKALMMGEVGIPIYGFRDHTGKLLHLAVIPNDRCPITIGHVFLDFADKTGEMAIQLTFDKGTETGLMQALQQALCRLLWPEFAELERPSTVALKSTDNIPIESLWKYWLDYAGHNIKLTILDGHERGLFASGNPTHVHLFQWLWPRIVQQHLDLFQDYFNTTPRRKQQEKNLPTAAPEMVWNYPEEYGLERCGTEVPPGLVSELRGQYLERPREDVMRWVPDNFDEIASAVYETIGEPPLHYSTGWSTYNSMLAIIQDL